MANPVDWTSVDMLVATLSDLLNPQEDVETIQKAISAFNKEHEIFHQAESALRDIGRDLQNKVDEQENCVDLSEIIEEQIMKVDALAKEKEDARLRLQKEQKDIESTAERTKKLEDEYMSLVSQCNSAKSEAQIAKAKVRNIFLLYHELSKIKWDYSSDSIAGVMTRTKFNDVIDFDIDPTDKTDYDIANTLWDLMEGEEENVLL